MFDLNCLCWCTICKWYDSVFCISMEDERYTVYRSYLPVIIYFEMDNMFVILFRSKKFSLKILGVEICRRINFFMSLSFEVRSPRSGKLIFREIIYKRLPSSGSVILYKCWLQIFTQIEGLYRIWRPERRTFSKEQKFTNTKLTILYITRNNIDPVTSIRNWCIGIWIMSFIFTLYIYTVVSKIYPEIADEWQQQYDTV